MLTETKNHKLKIMLFATGPCEKTVHIVGTGMTVSVRHSMLLDNLT